MPGVLTELIARAHEPPASPGADGADIATMAQLIDELAADTRSVRHGQRLLAEKGFDKNEWTKPGAAAALIESMLPPAASGAPMRSSASSMPVGMKMMFSRSMREYRSE